MAYDYEARLSSKPIHGNIPEFTREAIEEWLTSNSGDFQVVTDFAATIRGRHHCNACFQPLTEEIDFATEEGEITYNDCMFPVEADNEN